MFPKDVQNIIEAYGLDMGLCDETSSRKLPSDILRRSDTVFIVKVMERTHLDYFALENLDTDTFSLYLLRAVQRGLLEEEEVLNMINESMPHWDRTAAAWCFNNFEAIYLRRCQFWWNIGIEVYWGDREIIKQYLKKSKLLQAGQHFAFELFELEETKDDYLIGP